MHKTVSAAALITLATTLASCGAIVGKFVPPQTVENPAGLNGKTLSSSGPLQPAAVKGTVSYSTQGAPFADVAYPKDVPFDIRPHALEFQAGFTEATASGLCNAPQSAKVTLKTLKVEVSDAAGKATFNATVNATFNLTRRSSGVSSVVYSVNADDLATLKVGAAETDAFIRALTSGGDNTASVVAEIGADQDGLAGCSMSFKLNDRTKVILSDFS
ncbi:hypothetical protein [Deinococcus depolymerans]|uniref:Lipoprotein n=1 Tax=Deinococcus depolymerans TaxID=392408 RepID=A0ABN1CP51_9DEIO